MIDHAPTLSPDFNLMVSRKQQLLDALKPLLWKKDVVYVDYPIHLNIGDLLIQAGTEAAFEALQVKIVARIAERNAERLFKRKFSKQTVFVLHGGGNFGDLYPHHQRLRERIIEAFPENPVVIMPQSVHYTDLSELTSKAELYRHHPQLTMFVRDQASYDLMKQEVGLANLSMVPDMAFALLGKWAWPVPEELSKRNLKLRRRDIESVGGESGFDWDELFDKRDLQYYDLARRLCRYENRLGFSLGVDRLWLAFVSRITNRAVNYFNMHGHVDTDRLHGMILALLTGHPVIMRDNSYGKLRRYAECWLQLAPVGTGVSV